MRCRAARLGLLRRRRCKLDQKDHDGVLMAEYRRRTEAPGVQRNLARSRSRARTNACTGPEALPEMAVAQREQLEGLARQQRNAGRDRHESRKLAVA